MARSFGELAPTASALLVFVCECLQRDCYERLELTAPEYEEAHAADGRFVILASHDLGDGESEVLRHHRYLVVARADE